jgi:NAD(P)-dependent dehydrogenase (short-subunit alcohol dehydrogenase family)
MKRGASKVVVITGASSGIGRATAHEFARRGARIGLMARGREGLDNARREVEQLGGSALVLPTDVADHTQVAAAAEAVDREYGPVDVWVNNAVVTVIAPVKETTPEEFRRVTEVGYLGVVYGTLQALKRMLPRDRGTIIQIGSALSYRGIPLQGPYCGAQHAIKGFCDALRTELQHDNSKVHVTLIRPSGVNTPLWNHSLTRMGRLPRPIGRIYQPEVVARAIAWASEHKRREMSIGWDSVKAIYGNKAFPAAADWDLARSGYERQESEPAVSPNRPNNVWEPLPGDPGLHGPYNDESYDTSMQVWLSRHRGWLAFAGAGLAAATAIGFMSGNGRGRS